MFHIAVLLLGGGCIALTIVPITKGDAILPIVAGIALFVPHTIEYIKINGVGPKYLTTGYILLLVPVVLHVLLSPSIDNLIGFVIYLCIVPIYLTSYAIGPRLLYVFTVAGIIESIAIIITRSFSPHPSDGGIMGIAHFSCFVIMIGIFTAPKYLRPIIYILGPSAILLTGSEEGLLFLGVGALAMIWRRDWSIYTIIFFACIIITLSIILPTGHFADSHTKLASYRLDSIGNATNHRTTGISDNIGVNWIVGDGWKWDTTGGIKQAIHNAFLNIMSQYGILAAIGFFIIVCRPLFKNPNNKTFYITIIMFSGAMVDHFLVTYFFPWPYFIAGAISNNSFIDGACAHNMPKTVFGGP